MVGHAKRSRERVTSDDPELRRLLWFLLGGTVGGENRARIIYALRERPSNINQLAVKLALQYKAVQHHIEVLKKNSLIVSSGEHYGMTYMLTQWFEAHFEIFDEICARVGFRPGEGKQKSKD